MGLLTDLILRRAGTLLLCFALLTIGAAFYSVALFKNLRTDVEELLPETARSVVDLKEVTSRLLSTTNLSVVVFSDSVPAAERFLEDLSRKLARPENPQVAAVEFRVKNELQFFEARKALFVELDDLRRIRDYVLRRILYERELYNPINIVLEEELPEPKLDLPILLSKYEARSTNPYSNLPDGWYSTKDRKIHVALVHLAGKLSGIGSAHELRSLVDRSIAELNPSSYDPSLHVAFTGDVQNLIDEHEALLEDLVLSTVIVLVLVTLAMLIYFRHFVSTMLLVVSLLMGTLWTFGISYFAVGFLNANSAFLGGIVLGNGVNFGIIFLSRYLEERRARGKSHEEALRQAMVSTWKPTSVAAVAAAFSYGSLMLTEFRGFSQFGLIGLIGMGLCWISSFTAFPALLTLWERHRGLIRSIKPFRPHIAARFLRSLIGKAPWVLVGLTVILTVFSVVEFRRLDSKIIETDLSKLRSKRSAENGSMFYSHYVDQVFGRDLSPFILLAHDRGESARLVALMEEEIKKAKQDGTPFPITQVMALDRFVPDRQKEKAVVLRQIENLLPREIRARLSATEKVFVSSFLTAQAQKPFTEADLPDLVKRKFTERDGSRGNLVLVEVPLGDEIKDGDFLIGLVAKLRSISDSVRQGLAITGGRAVTADLYEAVKRDGPRAMLFALLSVIALVILLFRRPSAVFFVLLSLLLGVFWMAGVMLHFSWKINFLNFIAFPITFGIGIDYGVNLYQRYREEGPGKILDAVQGTGGAVVLASLTTSIGYGSLLIASNQAFVSFGRLAVLGEVTCIAAALLSLPALLLLRDRRKQ